MIKRDRMTEEGIVQNLFALHGLAPRLRALVATSEGWEKEVEPFLIGGEADTGKARKVVRKYRLGLRSKRDDARAAIHGVSFSGRWQGDKMVDFTGYYFRDSAGYVKGLRKRVQHRRGGSLGYQGVPELGIPGQRDHKLRVKQMKLKGLDFVGKSVLDLGCNVGRWCQEAVDRGASRVVGVDDRRIGLWTQVNNWISPNYWRIEFVKAELPYHWKQVRKATGQASFDIVICMAITPHCEGGYQPWIGKLTRELLIFEGDDKTTFKNYEADLKKDFDRVEKVGYVTDDGKRPLFHCYKDRRDDGPEAPANEGTADATEGAVLLDSVEPEAREDTGTTIRAARSVPESIPAPDVAPDAGGLRVATGAASGGNGDSESMRDAGLLAAGAGRGAIERDAAGPGDGEGEAEGDTAALEAVAVPETA